MWSRWVTSNIPSVQPKGAALAQTPVVSGPAPCIAQVVFLRLRREPSPRRPVAGRRPAEPTMSPVSGLPRSGERINDRTLASVGIVRFSSWNPSRGPTSLMVTARGASRTDRSPPTGSTSQRQAHRRSQHADAKPPPRIASPGSVQRRTIILPVLLPRMTPRNASTAFSKPSTVVSRNDNEPSASHPAARAAYSPARS